MSNPKIPIGKSALLKEEGLTDFFCPTTTYSIGVTNTAASSDEINTQIVRVFATVPTYIAFGETPTSATPDCPINASIEYFYYIPEGQKIGFIRFGSNNGTIYVSTVLTA